MPLACCLLFVLITLLRHADTGAYHNTSSSLSSVNPWLSACDLTSPEDLKGTCTAMRPPRFDNNRYGNNNGDKRPTEGPGPPCAAAGSTDKCLDDRAIDTVQCSSAASGPWSLRLPHCRLHSVGDVLPPHERVAMGESAAHCRRVLRSLLDVDELAATLSCKFGEVLRRYDCAQNYSVRHDCRHCQDAYREWTCASLLPYFSSSAGVRVRPCRSVCQRVEQQCPYFLPGDRTPAQPTQYAGEPTFLCLDANIPETGEQLSRSLFGSGCCFRPCGDGLCLDAACDAPEVEPPSPRPAAPCPSPAAAAPPPASTGGSRTFCGVPPSVGAAAAPRVHCCWTVRLLLLHITVIARKTCITILLLYIIPILEAVTVMGYT